MNIVNNTLQNGASIKKFINSSRQLGLTRDKRWIDKLVDTKRIYYKTSEESSDNHVLSNNHQRDVYKQQIHQLIDIFNSKYGNNWDIHLDYTKIRDKIRFRLSFIIHYEKIHISNSNGLNREIDNLIIVLPIGYADDYNCLFVTEVYGTKMSFQHDEWYSGYVHSHLGRIGKVTSFGGIGNASKFCLGDSELSELKMILSTEFDIGQFELMLYTIDSVVAWESIEGGPHVYMKDVVLEDKQLKVTTSTSQCIDLYKELRRKLPNPLPFNFVYTQDRYRIKHDDTFTKYLIDTFLNHSDLKNYHKYVVCKKGSDGHFYTFKELEQNSESPTDVLVSIKQQSQNQLPFVYIQGKQVGFKITNIQSDRVIDISEFIVYPKFLNYVSEQLECEIYRTCVRGSGINFIHNSSNYVRRDSAQN